MDEKLISWIDIEDQVQVPWMRAYLIKLGLAGDQIENLVGHPGIFNHCRSNIRSAEFREFMRRMRGSWRQKIYREKNGRQLSFQFSYSAEKQLSSLAKSRDQSKNQTILDLIKDAADEKVSENPRHKKRIEELKASLKRKENEKKDVQARYTEIINYLFDNLAYELRKRCELEARIGGDDGGEIDSDAEKASRTLIKKRSENIDERMAKSTYSREMRIRPLKTRIFSQLSGD